MMGKEEKNFSVVGGPSYSGTTDPPNEEAQHWLSEKAALELEIALKQERLTYINGRLRATGLAMRDDPSSAHAHAKPLAPVNRLSLIEAIEKIANESTRPISKAELRHALVAMGYPVENFNNYFYQAIRRLRSKQRIGVLHDGKVWRP